MDDALFDSITNSEDEMIARAGINKYHACTYLRAYIMASLCLQPQLIITDSAANLNRAFRTLIDHREGEGYYNLDYIPKADFDWLIREGHIRFAARNEFRGNFSEALRVSQQGKQAVDLPSEKYTRMIDEISSDKYIYWYDLEKVSQEFTSKFKSAIKHELEKDAPISVERAKLLRSLNDRFSNEQKITYNGVKSFLLKDQDKYYEKDNADYQYIRRILRQSYDYNLPDVLGVNYCMPWHRIRPSRNQDWKLELNEVFPLECSYLCSIYAFSELPVSHLQYIWESREFGNFRYQVNQFKAGVIDLDEYILSLEKYLDKINEVVKDVYAVKHNKNTPYEGGILSSIPVRIRYCHQADNNWIVAANVAIELLDTISMLNDFSSIIQGLFVKVLPVLAQKTSIIPEPPEEINEAIILQGKGKDDGNCNGTDEQTV